MAGPTTRAIAPWNNLFLVVIVLWLQTGYAMVLFSAAIKGIPEELLEAARVDGANEIQLFFRIMIPYILGTIITVTTTIIIFTLKIFRRGLGDDRGTVRHGRDRNAVLPAVFHQPQCRVRLGHRNCPVDCGHSGHDL